MNWVQAKVNWNQYKGMVKAKWDKLSEHDLETIGGDRDQLISTLQARYAIPREHAEEQVTLWERAVTLTAADDPARRRKVG